jgi:methionyl-tRNA formyltransferase
LDGLSHRENPDVIDPDQAFVLFAMNEKGLAVLRSLIDNLGAGVLAAVVVQEDPGVEHDYLREIADTAQSAGIRILGRGDQLPSRAFSVAVGWRFLIPDEPRLVVFHDSVLPRYRGFAPLVNALINGEHEIGVTALWGAEHYDSGPIIDQAAIAVNYPLTIQDAIRAVTPLYQRLVIKIARRLLAGEYIRGFEQDEANATYSIWRDEEDYVVDWAQDATRVARFIDALGPPYRGASSRVDGRPVRILQAHVEDTDLSLEIRHPGKVFSISDGAPTIVCGDGLITLDVVRDAATGETLLPWTHLRTRFTGV